MKKAGGSELNQRPAPLKLRVLKRNLGTAAIPVRSTPWDLPRLGDPAADTDRMTE